MHFQHTVVCCSRLFQKIKGEALKVNEGKEFGFFFSW